MARWNGASLSRQGLGRAKTSAVAPHVEISPSNCISGSQIILHMRSSMPCWRIVFSTFRGCMSFYTARVTLGRSAMSAQCLLWIGFRTQLGHLATSESAMSRHFRRMVRFLRRHGCSQGQGLTLGGVAETFVALNRGPRVEPMDIWSG